MLTCNLRVTARVSLCGGSGFGDQGLRFRTWAQGLRVGGLEVWGFKMLTCNLRVTARVSLCGGSGFGDQGLRFRI
jgi:hypothetical protein